MEKIHITLIVVIALLIAAIGYITYDKTRTAEVVIPQEEAGKQLPTPPEPPEEAPPEITDTTPKTIFAAGEAGEEITGTIVYIDYATQTVYFEEPETKDIYYTYIVDGQSEIFIDGIPATLDQFYIGMPLTVRWTDEPIQISNGGQK